MKTYGPGYLMTFSVPNPDGGWRIGGTFYPKTIAPYWDIGQLVHIVITGNSRLDAVSNLNYYLASEHVLTKDIYSHGEEEGIFRQVIQYA